MNPPWKTVDDLPERLRKQANNVEKDGWCKAAWLMRNAADEIEFYRKDTNRNT